ncbi:PAS domain-containing protein [Streptomyces sp. NPDC057540]|uniref:PAS domain-containing sensor histidine kinase n=1 Tax=Streptomyces sp. NPDC057540 TaxID=3346160 RepID=UPI00369AA3DE
MVSSLPRGTVRLSALLDALPDGLVLVDGTGTVVGANPVALGMFGACSTPDVAPPTGTSAAPETSGHPLVGRGLRDLLPDADAWVIRDLAGRFGSAGTRGLNRSVRTSGRRLDGGAFPVEVTRVRLEAGLETYEGGNDDEAWALVVRDLTELLGTESELARSRQQCEMILRATTEGVVGTDLAGRVVLVNPAFTRILGYEAGEVSGLELHPMVVPRRADGSPFPYEDSALADTLRTGHKHRVRGLVLKSKDGTRVPVDLTTAPVRIEDRLVGAVMAFSDRRPYERLIEEHTADTVTRAEQHAADRAEWEERYAEQRTELEARYAALADRHAELTALLAARVREEPNPRREDVVEPTRQAQVAVDRHPTTLGTVVNAGLEKASALTGSHRAHFAVHAPPVVVTLDPAHASTALAHLIADAAGVTSTGEARRPSASTPQAADTTVVITAAVRDDELRIEICGPRAVNDPAHLLVARRIVDAHGGVLTASARPRVAGLTYVVRIPQTPPHAPAAPALLQPAQAPVAGSWIIGAAVSARRDRAVSAERAASSPFSVSAPVLRSSQAGRSRPYVIPPCADQDGDTSRSASPSPVARRPERTQWGQRDADEADQQRIVRLLARIRRTSA